MDRPFKEMGERIRQARTAKSLTQQRLATVLNVSVQSVSQWETGRNQPELDRLIALSKIVGRHWTVLKYGPNADVEETTETRNRQSDQEDRFAPLTTLSELESLLNSSPPPFPIRYDQNTIVCRNTAVGRLFSFVLSGDHFAPAIRGGDLIVCDTGISVQTGDYVVVRSELDNVPIFSRVLGMGLNDNDEVVATLGTAQSETHLATVNLKDERNLVFGVMVEQRRFRFR